MKAKLLTLEEIKRHTVIAMFSDDELFENLVLKGGNALDLIHHLSSRSSVDLDFSMQHDFPEGVDAFRERVAEALKKTFSAQGYEAFDIKMEERPREISSELAEFWGGYAVEFKLVDKEVFDKVGGEIGELRTYAIAIGERKRFLIDVSRFEYTVGKQSFDLDGFRIYAYSPEMIVCEKLRAICQQMPAYGKIVKRTREGGPRARDFLDIHILVDALKLDVSLEKNKDILREMFNAKRVPLQLLGEIAEFREFHKTDFPAVLATVKAGVKLEEFDFYFDFVLGLAKKLESLWNV